MPKARVTVLGVKKKVNPIHRVKDNTDDLLDAEARARSRHSKMDAPGNSVPGTKTTAPPLKTTALPT